MQYTADQTQQPDWTAQQSDQFNQQQIPQQQYQPPPQLNPYNQQYNQQQYGQPQVAFGQPVLNNPYQQGVQVGAPVIQTIVGTNVNMPTPYNANGAPFPVQIICPVCKTQGITNLSTEIGSGTYLVSYLLFFCTGILCCWLPCVMPDCQDKVHRCSSCQAEVGIKMYEPC